MPCACSNIVFYVALGSLGAVGLLALLATGRVSPQNVLGLLIAVSNAFGLIAGASSMPRWPFHIPERGCAARAHVTGSMAEHLSESMTDDGQPCWAAGKSTQFWLALL